MNILTVFQRSAAGFALTPQERAFLRLAEGLVGAMLVAAIGVLGNLLVSGQLAFNHATLVAVSGAAFLALASAVKKLISAQGDGLIAPAPAGPLAAHADPNTLPPPPLVDGSAI